MTLNLEHSLTNEPSLARAPTREEVREYLDFHLAELVRRRDEEILPALARMAEQHPRIDDGDDETAGKFAENRNMAVALIKTAGERHREQKDPWRFAGMEVDDWKNGFVAILEAALKSVDEIALDYSNRKDAIERAKREEAARKAKEDADRRIVEAQRALTRDASGPQATVALETAAKASAAADRAQIKAEARASETSRTRGIYGATMGVRTTWGYEIDLDAMILAAAQAIAAGNRPEWLRALTIDESKLRELAAQRDARSRRPLAVIPGVTWVEKRAIGNASVAAA